MSQLIDVLMLGAFVLFMIYILKGFTKQQMQKHLDRESKKDDVSQK